MIQSMTGYASGQGTFDGYRWSWELRSVNGKGLDLRMRMPDWIDGLEAAVRPILAKAAKRGNVTFNLRVQREEQDGRLSVNAVALDKALTALGQIEVQAATAGINLAQTSAADIASLRGVLDSNADDADTSELKSTLIAALPGLIADFSEMRAAEGAALDQIIRDQIAEISRLTHAAADLLDQRQSDVAANLRKNLARVMENVADIDEARVAQELAMLTVKSDVTEEVDRLNAHVAAANDLLDQSDAVGRKLDFLCQEFNREANTLCSKAQMSELTEIGLALKVTVDQMREQIQNVE